MCEPFGLSAIFASIGSALKVADVAVRIAEVGNENEVFVRTIHNVRDSLNEVERLLSSDPVQIRLAETPGKIPWIQRTINSSKSALNDIGRWVERARAEQQSTGSVQFSTRLRWILNDHEKLVNRTAELGTCHQQLSTVLNYLTPLERAPVEAVKSVPDHGANLDDIFSKHRRRTTGNFPIISSTNSASIEPCVHVVPQYPRSDGPPPLVAHMSHGNIEPFERGLINESPLPAWPSFKEPPTSPPPSYATVVESVVRRRQAHMDQKRHLRENQFEHQDVSQGTDLHSPVNKEEQYAWAYRMQHIDQPVSELAGDTVDMSGTNCLGPVNPYDYGTIHEPVALIRAAASPDVRHVAELLGDLAFVVELPSNDPGSPPGYPSRSNGRALFHSPSYTSSSRVPMGAPRVPVHELSAAPKRRLLPSHTVSEPLPGPHQSSPTLSISELGVRSPERAPIIGQHYNTVASNKTYTRSSSVAVASLNRSPPTEPSLPSPEPQTSLQHTPSASSARMQRQKQMMDFFSSIG